ncbi:39S ribosomal protein L52, mitochondrial [Bulinus truncatus]|nr:39S ribosomal protein L52, mitochondrial [Bulinus truncatus]
MMTNATGEWNKKQTTTMATRMLLSKECDWYLRTCKLFSSEQCKVLLNSASCFHTSHSFLVDRRKDKAISQYLYYQDHHKTLRHRNLLLVQLPDYSYIDGRPTELGISQKQRQERNYLLTKQIVHLLDEMKLAQNEYISKQRLAEEAQQKLLNSTLKAKGTDL